MKFEFFGAEPTSAQDPAAAGRAALIREITHLRLGDMEDLGVKAEDVARLNWAQTMVMVAAIDAAGDFDLVDLFKVHFVICRVLPEDFTVFGLRSCFRSLEQIWNVGGLIQLAQGDALERARQLLGTDYGVWYNPVTETLRFDLGKSNL